MSLTKAGHAGKSGPVTNGTQEAGDPSQNLPSARIVRARTGTRTGYRPEAEIGCLLRQMVPAETALRRRLLNDKADSPAFHRESVLVAALSTAAGLPAPSARPFLLTTARTDRR